MSKVLINYHDYLKLALLYWNCYPVNFVALLWSNKILAEDKGTFTSQNFLIYTQPRIPPPAVVPSGPNDTVSKT